MTDDLTHARPRITAVIVSFNGERLLDKCLESLDFCDEILIVDSFSTDQTQAIAARHNALFIQHAWPGPGWQLRFALEHVHTDWVFTLDCDEICTPELRDSILAALEHPAAHCAFYCCRRTWYYDRFMAHSGWYPDKLLRLFRRDGVEITQTGGHPHILPSGPTAALHGDILHYSYESLANHLEKVNFYAQKGADDLRTRGHKGGITRGLLHGMARFLRVYVLKRGFLDGRAGFINALHAFIYAMFKYIRIDEGNWTPYAEEKPKDAEKDNSHQQSS